MVTPGSNAPDVSLTTPVIVAWASATDGTKTSTASTTHAARILRISLLVRCDPRWIFGGWIVWRSWIRPRSNLDQRTSREFTHHSDEASKCSTLDSQPRSAQVRFRD